MSQARRFERSPKKRLRREELPHMETNEQAQRERYREVERALVKLVEEIEEVEDGDVKVGSVFGLGVEPQAGRDLL